MFNPANLTLHQMFDIGSAIVLVSSLANSFLPPYEWFAQWPRFQSVYKILTMTIARWGAINLKSTIYPSVSVDSQAKTNGGTK